MKAEEILEHRRTALEVFVTLVVAYIVVLYYRSRNPYSYPGIEARFQFALAMLGIFVVLLYLPYGRIIARFKSIELERFSRLKEEKRRYSQMEYFKRSVGAVFQILLLLFLIALLIQQIGPEMIRIDMSYFLIAVILFGAIHVLLSSGEEEIKKGPTTKMDYILAGIMGIAGASIVWYKIQDIGALSYIISTTSGILIILLSILILEEEE